MKSSLLLRLTLFLISSLACEGAFGQASPLVPICGLEGQQGTPPPTGQTPPNQIYVTLYLHNCVHPDGSGGLTQQQIDDIMAVTYDDFAPHGIILRYEMCQNLEIDDPEYGYFVSTEQQPFDVTANNYACGGNGIDVFFLPDDFVNNAGGLGGSGSTAGGGSALTIPSTRLFIWGKTNCTYPAFFQYQNNIQVPIATVPHFLSHELGHCLGLSHPHDDPAFGPAPNLNFCVNQSCEWTETTIPAGCLPFQTTPFTYIPQNQPNYGNPPYLDNIMAYTNYYDCAPVFTLQQGQTMRAFLFNHPTLSKIVHGEINGNVTISAPTVWTVNDFPNGNVNIGGSINILSGASLTIESGVSVRLAESSKITVNKNASLILRGYLGPSCCTYWQGVEVLGTANLFQQPATHGLFLSEAGAVVEYAKIGVHSIDGGVVNATGTTFRNNGTAIRFDAYKWQSFFFNYGSQLQQCLFTYNGTNPTQFGETSNFLRSHIMLFGFEGWGSDHLPILGCTFENTYVNSNLMYPVLYGILAFSSEFEVNAFNPGGGAAQEPSSFRNLLVGVLSVYAAGGGYSEVVDSKFAGCNIGIWSYSSSIDIDGNTFSEGCIPFSSQYISTNPNLTPIPDQFGVFLSSTTPLLVFDGNHFVHNENTCSSSNINTVGSYIQNIGDFNHFLIYNQYTDLDYGNIADGANASNGINGPKGLHYLCNTNSGSQRYDFAVTQGGSIRREQGLFSGSGDLFFPAGNVFSYSGASNDLSDFNNQGVGVRYYYNGTLVGQEPLDYAGLIPIEVILPDDCSRRERTMASEFTNEDLQQIKNSYFAYQALYNQALGERNQATNAGNTVLAEQKTLEMSGYQDEMDFAVSRVAEHAMVMDAPRDTLRAWLSRYERVEAEYMVAREYLADNRPLSADSVLQLTPQKFTLTSGQITELNAVRAIVNLLAGKDVFNLDAATVSALQIYADGNVGHANQWARAIRMMYGHWYPLEYELPEGAGERSEKGDNIEHDIFGKPTSPYQIVPNPATNQAVFIRVEAELPLTLEIFDITGHKVLSYNLVSGQSTQDIDLSAMPTGVYVFRLRDERQIIATEKFLISK